jgi:L-aminopeptidase/D-esterase-like protein
VIDADGSVIAGALPGDDDGVQWPPAGTNTTLVVVATNAKLSKERANLLAIAAHEGIDAAVRPAHTAWDGDTVFTLATGEVEAEQSLLEAAAIRVTAEAIRSAVR